MPSTDPTTTTIPAPPTVAETDSELIRRDEARLLLRLSEFRRMQSETGSEIPSDVSERKMAQTLIYETLGSLARADIVLRAALELLIDDVEVRRESNRLKLIELEMTIRRQHAEDRYVGIVDRGTTIAVAVVQNPKFWGWIGGVGGIGTILGAWARSHGWLGGTP